MEKKEYVVYIEGNQEFLKLSDDEVKLMKWLREAYEYDIDICDPEDIVKYIEIPKIE